MFWEEGIRAFSFCSPPATRPASQLPKNHKGENQTQNNYVSIGPRPEEGRAGGPCLWLNWTMGLPQLQATPFAAAHLAFLRNATVLRIFAVFKKIKKGKAVPGLSFIFERECANAGKILLPPEGGADRMVVPKPLETTRQGRARSFWPESLVGLLKKNHFPRDSWILFRQIGASILLLLGIWCPDRHQPTLAPSPSATSRSGVFFFVVAACVSSSIVKSC